MHAPAEGIARRAPQRLAIDGDVLQSHRLTPLRHPLTEALREHLGVEGAEDAIDSVVAGDAVGELEEGAQPGFAALGEGVDRFEGGRSADDPDEGDHENVVEAMLLGAFDSGIGDGGEMFEQRLPCHGESSEVSPKLPAKPKER